MLKTKGDSVKGKTVLISGSGNVAQYTAEKVLQLGGKVVTMSDSDGYIYDPDGIDREKLDFIMAAQYRDEMLKLEEIKQSKQKNQKNLRLDEITYLMRGIVL